MSAERGREPWLGLIVGALAVQLAGLALGAVWALLVLRFGDAVPPWLVLAVAALTALSAHLSLPPVRGAAALLAALATLLAALYEQFLLAAARLAAMFGIGLLESLRASGFSMLWLLARIGLRGERLDWALAAAALAALLAWRWSGKAVGS
jgi:vitamin B12 transport system permease protein